jgi:adenylate cyclase
VIARNSVQAYKGQSPDIRKIGEEFGARYVIEGSVRRAGERIRVTAQLVDAGTVRQVWAEKFDRRIEDIFDLQDELTHRIAATVVPELEQEEHKRSVLKPPRNLDAWEFYLRGNSALQEPTREGTSRAREMFGKALERDPNYARAHAGIAFSHGFDLVAWQSESRQDSMDHFVAAARQAAMLDRSDSMTQLVLSMSYTWTGQDDLSVAAAEKSIELNPSNAIAYGHLGTMLDVIGRHDDGIAHLEHCVRLSPKEPLAAHIHMTFLARALLSAGRYEDAIAWGQRALAQHTPYPPANYIIGIGLAHLGRQSDAFAALEQCEREQPGFVEERTTWRPYRDQSKNEHILDGLRKAGWEH